MAEPALRRADERGGRFYEHPSRTEPDPDSRTPDGSPWQRPARYVSVTTALDVVAKEALVYWAGNLTAARAMSDLPKLIASILKPDCGRARARKEPLGCGECVACTEAWLALAHHGEKSRRAREGTAAHDVLEGWINRGVWEYVPQLCGDPAVDQYVPTVEVVAPYVARLREWAADYGLEPGDFQVSECTVWNHRLKYAGTLDFIVTVYPRTKKAAELCARINFMLGQPLDQPVVILGDAKSRENDGAAIYAEYVLQLTGYRFAETMTPKGAASADLEIPMIQVDAAAILQVRPDGYAFRPVVTTGREMRTFEAVLALSRWTVEHGDECTLVRAFPLPDGWKWTPPVPPPAELLAEQAEAPAKPVRKRAPAKKAVKAVPADPPAARLGSGAGGILGSIRSRDTGVRQTIPDDEIPF